MYIFLILRKSGGLSSFLGTGKIVSFSFLFSACSERGGKAIIFFCIPELNWCNFGDSYNIFDVLPVIGKALIILTPLFYKKRKKKNLLGPIPPLALVFLAGD